MAHHTVRAYDDRNKRILFDLFELMECETFGKVGLHQFAIELPYIIVTDRNVRQLSVA